MASANDKVSPRYERLDRARAYCEKHQLRANSQTVALMAAFADSEDACSQPVAPGPAKPRLPVGVSVLLTNSQGQVLLGRRKNNSASGMLSTPGGRIEESENMFQCARREFEEETGATLNLGHLSVLGFKEHFRFGNHYIMLYIHATKHNGEIINAEPEKCEGWQWFDITAIPANECTEPQDILRMLAAPPQVSAPRQITGSTFDLWWPEQEFQPPNDYRELSAIAVAFAKSLAGAVSAPRCPVCAGEVTWKRGAQRAYCKIGMHMFDMGSEQDWQQFFQPEAQPAPWVSTKERLPEDDSDVFAAIWWRNGDNPDYSRYAIHDCIYREHVYSLKGPAANLFVDCEGEEFEPADVQYWIYKKDLAATLPAQPSPEGRS